MQNKLRKSRARLIDAALIPLLSIALTSLTHSAPLNTWSETDKPNVILIVTDDHGYGDVGAYGGKDIKTPNMDKIAESGIRFTQFYATSAVCSPSRSSLMTGKTPQRAGVPSNAAHPPKGKKIPGLKPEQVTVAEIMKSAGYRTAQIGKWHLGFEKGRRPTDQGFDYSFGHRSGAIDNYSHFVYWNGPNRHDLQRNNVEIHRAGEFFPDLMVEEAVKFIDQKNDKPFFMYFAMNTPHYPYQGDAKWLKYYQDAGVPYPRDIYNAFVSTIDERIGHLLTALNKRNLSENTIIMFQSDHGHSTEDRAHYGGGSAGIYRGAKKSLFEGGIRVPAMISWPAKLPKGLVREQMATGADWMPTLADILDIDIAHLKLDGKSMMPIISDDTADTAHESFTWALGGRWAVRQGPWKLLADPLDTTAWQPKEKTPNKSQLPKKPYLFLVNIDDDPSEKINVAKKHPDIVQRLLKIRELKRRQF
jgi:arylsulfatase A